VFIHQLGILRLSVSPSRLLQWRFPLLGLPIALQYLFFAHQARLPATYLAVV
jgi:hypothetical protein